MGIVAKAPPATHRPPSSNPLRYGLVASWMGNRHTLELGCLATPRLGRRMVRRPQHNKRPRKCSVHAGASWLAQDPSRLRPQFVSHVLLLKLSSNPQIACDRSLSDASRPSSFCHEESASEDARARGRRHPCIRADASLEARERRMKETDRGRFW